MRKSIVITVVLSIMMLIQSCGSDDVAEVEKAGEIAEQATKTITATEGGNLQTASGSVSLEVPATALGEDTELTVNTLDTANQPDSENLGSYVFDFGPDGLEFKSPATLSLKLSAGVPAGKTAHIATLEDGKWKNISGSQVIDGSVSASISHFSLYVIIFKADGSVDITTEGECSELDFSACGGDILGKWNVKDLCISATLGPDSDDESIWWSEYEGCDDTGLSTNVNYTGYLEYNSDNTFDNTLYIESTESIFTLDKDCLESIGNTPEWAGTFANAEQVCSFMDSSYSGQSTGGGCEYQNNVCTCTINYPSTDDEPETISGYYQIEGNNLLVGDSMDSLTQKLPYCISDNRLVIEMLDFDQDEVMDHMILEKE